jgi:hypothetical protein
VLRAQRRSEANGGELSFSSDEWSWLKFIKTSQQLYEVDGYRVVADRSFREFGLNFADW